MNWPINWTSLEQMPYENFERWKEASTTFVLGDDMRPLWFIKEPPPTSQGQQPKQQPSEEHRDTLRGLPREDSREGKVEWTQQKEGVPELWERVYVSASEAENMLAELWQSTGVEVPRTASGVESRVNRLKAIGNGQVPIVAATAWKLLTS